MLVKDFSKDLRISQHPNTIAQPRVSVILPTYARGHGPLQLSIESVLCQTAGDFELIIVDDGSRDGTSDVLNEYVKSDSRVVVHSYQKNSGLPALRVDQAALLARGDFIAYQFDDDLWMRDSLKYRVHELERSPGPSVVYTNAEIEIDGVTKTLGGEFNYGLLVNGNYIANNTVMHHRSLFDIAGMYDPHVIMRRFSDYDLRLRFARFADFIWIDETLSSVNAGLDDSLGKDVALYLSRYRKLMSFDRNQLLRPSMLERYDVVGLDLFSNTFPENEVLAYYRQEALPFLSKFNDYCSEAELAVSAAKAWSRCSVLVTKPCFSTSIDVTIDNFVRLPFQSVVRTAFVKEADLPFVDTSSFDLCVLHRTVGRSTTQILNSDDRVLPVAYLMDDNMLAFHEVGPDHAFLAPGTETYWHITSQISSADSAIGYSEPIVEDMKLLNSKVMRLRTAIPAQYVSRRTIERSKRLRVALLSGPLRAEVVRKIWGEIVSFAERHTEQVEFHFWGLDPDTFGKLPCPVYYKPFTHSYGRYVDALSVAEFDVQICPLDGGNRAEHSKSPVKLLEGVAAGAFTIFSSVEPYSLLPDDCCIKVGSHAGAWESALDNVLAMGLEERECLFGRAFDLVHKQYSCESQYYDFLAVLKAVGLHRKLTGKAIAFVFHEAALGGATLHLLRHAELMRSLGFSVVGLVPSNNSYGEAFRQRWLRATAESPLVFGAWPSGYVREGGLTRQRAANGADAAIATDLKVRLAEHDIGLLHFATWSPVMVSLARQLNVASVASVHQYYAGGGSAFRVADAIHCSSWTHGSVWAKVAKAPVRRIVCPVDTAYFDAFAENRARVSARHGVFRILVSGTLQARKNQLAAIQTLALLRQAGLDCCLEIIGYTELVPAYVEECTRAVRSLGLTDYVTFHGFVGDPVTFYKRVDLLLISATDESMPQTMLQAMAAGIAVVSTKVGGVTEIVKHRYTGFLARTAEPSDLAEAVLAYAGLGIDDRLEIVDRARRSMDLLARPSYVRAELVDLYLEALAGSAIEHRSRATSVAGKGGSVFDRLNGAIEVVEELHQDAVMIRNSKLSRLRQTIQLSDRCWNNVSPAFSALKSYTKKHLRFGSSSRLHLGGSLSKKDYCEYTMPWAISRLTSISIAVRPLIKSVMGEIGLEVVASHDEVLQQVTLPLGTVDSEVPVRFVFPRPITGLERNWRLRVFVVGADVPVALYEVLRHPFAFGRRSQVPLVLIE